MDHLWTGISSSDWRDKSKREGKRMTGRPTSEGWVDGTKWGSERGVTKWGIWTPLIFVKGTAWIISSWSFPGRDTVTSICLRSFTTGPFLKWLVRGHVVKKNRSQTRTSCAINKAQSFEEMLYSFPLHKSHVLRYKILIWKWRRKKQVVRAKKKKKRRKKALWNGRDLVPSGLRGNWGLGFVNSH